MSHTPRKSWVRMMMFGIGVGASVSILTGLTIAVAMCCG